MASAEEAFFARTPLGSDLKAGVDTLSLNQEVTFTQYVKVILPFDGYVFWVRADKLSETALLNSSVFNSYVLNLNDTIITPAKTIDAKGSFHIATDLKQEEEEVYAVNRVIFTSEVEVNNLNRIAPNDLYIATYGGVRFAFSARGSFYKQADLYHYTGSAIYADMDSQIIDDPLTLDTRNIIVSNSLPIWLSLNGYAPTLPSYGFGNPYLMLYPSFLSPNNMVPPFGAVHIYPESTLAIAAAPFLGRDSTHSQLAKERVKITIWGLRNYNAQDFLDCIYQYSRDYDYIGLMNIPIIRDEKRTQSELSTIAMKKSIEFEISYKQSAVRNIARQMIEKSIPSVSTKDFY